MTWLDRAVKVLLPREEGFFDLLERGAACARDAGRAMRALCGSATADERDAQLERLRDIEHAADSVIHETFDALNRTFVTPIDRSDIYTLATHLEDVVDLNHATGMLVRVHAMDDVPEGAAQLAALIADATEEMRHAVTLLRDLKKLDNVRAHTKRLSQIEHEGDELFRARLGSLFREEKNAIRLIQHKEFLEGLERTLDACDHVGWALEAITIRNG